MTNVSPTNTFVAAAVLLALVGCGDNPAGAPVGGERAAGTAGPTHRESDRRSYLLTLGDRYLSFRAVHGKSPASTEEFVAHVSKGEMDEILKVAVVKLQSGNIEMVWKGKQILNGGHPYVWGYEKQAEVASGFVLMSNSSVIQATREEFAKLQRLPQDP